MNLHKALRLDGGIVALRDFSQADLDQMAQIVADPRVTDWLSFDPRDRPAAQRMLTGAITAAEQDPRTEYYLGVVLPEDDTVLGFARLAVTTSTSAKLGYAIHADRWGHGYATAAARVLVDHGFTKLGLHRITAAAGPDNAASHAVLTRIGFSREGRLRDHVHTHGAWRDSILYSLLATDPRT